MPIHESMLTLILFLSILVPSKACYVIDSWRLVRVHIEMILEKSKKIKKMIQINNIYASDDLDDPFS